MMAEVRFPAATAKCVALPVLNNREEAGTHPSFSIFLPYLWYRYVFIVFNLIYYFNKLTVKDFLCN
jgi:hypothetical protein